MTEVDMVDREIAGELTKENAHLCFHQMFSAQAVKTPDAVAVSCDGVSLSYQALDNRSNQLAAYLRQLGIGQGDIVGFCLERSVEMVAAILAIWKSGAAYLPVDPEYPEQRVSYITNKSAPALFLTTKSSWHYGATLDVSSCPVVCLDDEDIKNAVSTLSANNPGVVSSASDLAYVIFTSGSTGMPKGVMVEHGSLSNLVFALSQAIGFADFPVGYNALQNASIAFDSSIKQLIHLLHGASLHIVTDEDRKSPERFVSYINQHNIYCFDSTPSMLKALLMAAKDNELTQHDSCCLVGGEYIDKSLWTQLSQVKKTTYFNVYGVTECTVDSTVAKITSDAKEPSIGEALANVECLVVNDGQLAADGEIGELVIGGVSVARGYLNDPQLTAERFIDGRVLGSQSTRLYKTGDLVRQHQGGRFEFVGRDDTQIKLRGYRIELGEVEDKFREIDQVDDVVVTTKKVDGRVAQMLAFVTLQGDIDRLNINQQLMSQLAERLPDYMLPQRIIPVDSIPLTANAKVDTQALLQIAEARASGAKSRASGAEPPSTDTEKAIHSFWLSLLDIDEMGVDENFFYLGGDSLMTMKLISNIKKHFGVEIRYSDIFDNPTVRDLSSVVDQQAPGDEISGTLSLAPEGQDNILALEEKLLFSFEGHVNPPMLMTFDIKGDFDVANFNAAVTAVFEKHKVLRTAVEFSGEEPLRKINANDGRYTQLIKLASSDYQSLEEVVDAVAYSLDINQFSASALVEVEPTLHVFVLAMGHMVSDIWSFDVFTKDLSLAYSNLMSGHEPVLDALQYQYSDYSYSQQQWMMAGQFNGALTDNMSRLTDLPPMMNIPTDVPREQVNSYLMQTVPMTIAKEFKPLSAELCSAQGITPYIIFLSAFYVLLTELSECEESIVVCPASSRYNADVDDLIGCYLNLIMLRNKVDRDATFRELLSATRQSTVSAYNAQNVPSLMLQGALFEAYGEFPQQIFQACFDYNPEPGQPVFDQLSVENFKAEQVDLKTEREGSTFDFIWMLREEGDEVVGRVSYNEKLFQPDTMTKIVNRFGDIVSQVVANPDIKISALIH